MLQTVEGTYRRGKIELHESAPAQEGSRVLVTFLTVPNKIPVERTMIQFGMFRTQDGPETSWEDFQEAKRAIHKNIEEP